MIRFCFFKRPTSSLGRMCFIATNYISRWPLLKSDDHEKSLTEQSEGFINNLYQQFALAQNLRFFMSSTVSSDRIGQWRSSDINSAILNLLHEKRDVNFFSVFLKCHPALNAGSSFNLMDSRPSVLSSGSKDFRGNDRGVENLTLGSVHCYSKEHEGASFSLWCDRVQRWQAD